MFKVVIFNDNDEQVYSMEFDKAGVVMLHRIRTFLNGEYIKLNDSLNKNDFMDIADLIDDINYADHAKQHMPYGYDIIICKGD